MMTERKLKRVYIYEDTYEKMCEWAKQNQIRGKYYQSNLGSTPVFVDEIVKQVKIW